MKTLIVAVLVLGAAAAPARAEEPCFAAHCDGKLLHFHAPGPVAIGLHVAATLSLALDVSSAFDIKNHQHDNGPCADCTFGYGPHSITEPNPLLGRHPSDWKLLGYFVGVAALHTALWYVLPEELRWIPDVAMLMVEVPQIATNRGNGLAFRLPF